MDELKLLLALIIFTVLFSIGIGLGKDDFTRLLRQPKAVIATLCCQTFLLPLCAIAIIKIMSLSGDLALGLLLISVCPGGVSSNLFTRLAGGDTALSISLTAFNSLFSVVSIPSLIFVGQLLIGEEAKTVEVPVAFLFKQLIFITLIPLLLGMLIHHRAPALAKRIEPLLMRLVTVAFFFILFALWRQEWDGIKDAFISIGTSTILLLLFTTLSGFVVSRLLKLNLKQESTMIIEVGIQNNGIAFFIAINVLSNSTLSTPAAVYTVAMTGAGFMIVAIYRYLAKQQA